jgi:hypothetical protein
MKTQRSNNKAITIEVAKSSQLIADAIGFNPDDNSISVDLKTFSESLQPEIANEFLSVLANKIVSQRVYDTLAGWNNPYEVFRRESSPFGDAEELLSVAEIDADEYSTTSDITDHFVPDVKVSFIYTTHKKVWKTSVSMELLKGAFVSDYGLADLVSLIIKKLRDSKELFLYDTITEELKTGIEKEVEITEITGLGESEASRKAYEQIISLAMNFSMPTKNYNESDIRSATPLGEAILILNASYKASFDVNVMASLLNSAKIGDSSYFKKVLVVDLGVEEDNIMGFMLDVDKYIYKDRILTTTTYFDASNLISTTRLFNFVKTGINPHTNGVALVLSESVE